MSLSATINIENIIIYLRDSVHKAHDKGLCVFMETYIFSHKNNLGCVG